VLAFTTGAQSGAATTLGEAPAPPFAGVNVNINFKVENVVFSDLTEDHKTELRQDIQNMIAVQTGVPMANVIVTLSAGSVVVNVEVIPTESINAATITHAAVSGKSTIAENVIGEMKKMPGFIGSPTIDVSTFTATERTPSWTIDVAEEDMASQGAVATILSVVAPAFCLFGI
jgi:hypothetical protein